MGTGGRGLDRLGLLQHMKRCLSFPFENAYSLNYADV